MPAGVCTRHALHVNCTTGQEGPHRTSLAPFARARPLRTQPLHDNVHHPLPHQLADQQQLHTCTSIMSMFTSDQHASPAPSAVPATPTVVRTYAGRRSRTSAGASTPASPADPDSFRCQSAVRVALSNLGSSGTPTADVPVVRRVDSALGWPLTATSDDKLAAPARRHSTGADSEQTPTRTREPASTKASPSRPTVAADPPPSTTTSSTPTTTKKRVRGPLDQFFLATAKRPARATSSSSSSTSPSAPTAPRADAAGARASQLHQMRLDFGQRGQGARECRECGMSYVATDEKDRKLHDRHHAQAVRGIEYPGYKNDRVVWSHDDARLVATTWPPSSSALATKLRSVVAHTDRVLGAVDHVLEPGHAVVVYIRGRVVSGVCVAEPRSVAFPATADGTAYDRARPVEAKFAGIARVWVDSKSRRQGVATRLLDAVAEAVGADEGRARVAFSAPTTAGWALARSYTGDEDEVLVYDD
ncbi:hypothetical protein AMAG_09279 [Allomyces macrogynus ATCC 38327]|uniref:N-acetyltransferase domain-containing protein n=1 Tax=Allomyces macrogynus (strain ATCC 38327) TaxID=578462 RepID=A0A0L0SP22_ALLM3|nr:hypothetical protein AMAG_09279 [Allomyces macrogynus ATCC 38327]|eukprot:KNE64242.1 hypothetical protein AMAG_09279 [Allomyces macrogynus ATCC 38327]